MAPICPRKRPQLPQKTGVSSNAPSAQSNVTATVLQFEQIGSKAARPLDGEWTLIVISLP
jgi:hypothetical protein